MARELRHGPARAREHRGCSERAVVVGSFRRPNHGPPCVQVPDERPLTRWLPSYRYLAGVMSTCAVYVTACVPITAPEQFVSFLAGIFAFNGTENDPPNSLSGSFTVSANVTITVVLAVSSTALPFAGETRKSYDCPFEHTAVMGTDVGAETGSAAATTAELPTKITARLSTVTLQRNLVTCCPPSSVRPSDGRFPV